MRFKVGDKIKFSVENYKSGNCEVIDYTSIVKYISCDPLKHVMRVGCIGGRVYYLVSSCPHCKDKREMDGGFCVGSCCNAKDARRGWAMSHEITDELFINAMEGDGNSLINDVEPWVPLAERKAQMHANGWESVWVPEKDRWQ